MLKWLTFRAYNRLDPIWFIWSGLAWHDCHYFAALFAIVVGCVFSACLEAWNHYREVRP